MSEFLVVPDVFRQYGVLNATQATAVATAGAVDQAATVAAAVPVFGPIGADFLAVFAAAQANHMQAVAKLAEVHAATAISAGVAASAVEGTDAASAAGFVPLRA
ncbi:type VII secretion target [Nocardia asiatica]|uniref:type VII secretion target n=1 Tax=Nocardia asiatica TaxID=209252 RepID=UPI003EE1BC26